MRLNFDGLKPLTFAGLLIVRLGFLAPSSCSGATVTLAWNASTSTNAAGYTLYYGPTSGNYTNALSVGNVTNSAVTGLAAGGTYYFAATVTDTSGLESVYSTEVSYTVPVPVTNLPPTLDPLTNLSIPENAAAQTVLLTGITAGVGNTGQSITITAASSNPALIPNPTVNYTNPNTTGSISFAPVALATGTATLTVTVNNGASSNNVVSRSFTVMVDPLPTISAITNVTIAVNSQTPPIPFTISSPQTAASNLTLYASSSNPSLAPTTNIWFAGTDSNRTVTVKPLAGQVGASTITLTVSDAIASASTSFKLSVLSRPAPPTNVHIASQ